MIKVIIIFMAAGAVLSASGCTKIKRKIQANTHTESKPVNTVKEVSLAKAILHPRPYKFTFTKDPFMPLLGKVFYNNGESADINIGTELKLIGVVMLGDNSVALLESPLKTGAFKEGDTIGNYIVMRINKDSVVLAKGRKKIVLKVGGENE